MKKINFILIFLLSSGWVFPQTIRVVDKTTQQTIQGVAVYSDNQKVSSETNFKGEIDVSVYKSADIIYFKLIGYETAVYTYQQLESMKFKVELVEKRISLYEVIISANRWEENKLENPYRIEKIDMKEVSFLNPQTSADLIGSSGYAYIQKSQLAGGSPSLRGFATNRVMLVVDGVRMNNAIFRTGNLQNSISIDSSSL